MLSRIYAFCDYTDKKFKIKYAHLKRKKNYQTKIILNTKISEENSSFKQLGGTTKSWDS